MILRYSSTLGKIHQSFTLLTQFHDEALCCLVDVYKRQRMGFSGPKYKELRHTLMQHLNGYAAFKSAADMRAHCVKCAAKRRELREAARTKDEIESGEASE